MKTHELFANPETVHWGYFDYQLEPILTISSGDRLIVHTLSGWITCMPDDPSRYPKELTAIHQNSRKGAGPHILLGPIHVEGAEPGDTLEVAIEEVKPWCDWGYNVILPLNARHLYPLKTIKVGERMKPFRYLFAFRGRKEMVSSWYSRLDRTVFHSSQHCP